jgi:DNA polymerase-3 subunit delta
VTYLIYGEDSFGVHEALRSIRTRYKGKFGTINIVHVDGAHTSAAELVGTTGATPLIASHRLVIITNLMLETPLARHKGYVPVVEAIPQTTVALFVEYGKPPRTSPLFEHLNRPKYTVVAHLFSTVELSAWIAKIVREGEETITQDALDLIIKLFPTDRWQIYNEIQKALLFAHATGAQIDRPLLETLLKTSPLVNRYGMQEAVFVRSSRSMLGALSHLEEAEMIPVLAGLIGAVRTLLLVNAGKENASAQALSEMGIHPYVGLRARGALKHYKEGEIEALFHTLAEIDFLVKSGEVEPRAALTQVALSL